VRRLIANKPILSFVPGKQCIRSVKCAIKRAVVVNNLLDGSVFRILHTLTKGETDPENLTQIAGQFVWQVASLKFKGVTGSVGPPTILIASALKDSSLASSQPLTQIYIGKYRTDNLTTLPLLRSRLASPKQCILIRDSFLKDIAVLIKSRDAMN